MDLVMETKLKTRSAPPPTMKYRALRLTRAGLILLSVALRAASGIFVALMKYRIPAAAVCLFLTAILSYGQINSIRVLTDIGTGNATLSIDGLELRGAGLFWWKHGATGSEINHYQSTLGIKGGVSKYSLSLDRSDPFYVIH